MGSILGARLWVRLTSSIIISAFLAAVVLIPSGKPGVLGRIGVLPETKANGSYHALNSGNLNFSVHSGNPNQITANDDWSGVASVEAYQGDNLTGSTGVDPQTVTGTEFGGSSHALPNTPANVAANKNNPNAYNAGGVAEFDSGSFLALGLQGSVQANPYVVFFLNTTGQSGITFSFDAIDIDGGSNNSVSPLAMQYRIGSTGAFTNIPAGYIADVTQGPTTSGLVTSRSVVLPADAANKPQVQVRLITTNAAGSDEWIGINNVVAGTLAPTAAPANLSGRVFGADGRGLSGAIVTVVDQYGLNRSVTTGTFGYYKFANLESGQSYVVTVRSRRYVFDAQVVTLNESLSGIDFSPLGGGQTIVPPRFTLQKLRGLE